MAGDKLFPCSSFARVSVRACVPNIVNTLSRKLVQDGFQAPNLDALWDGDESFKDGGQKVKVQGHGGNKTCWKEHFDR